MQHVGGFCIPGEQENSAFRNQLANLYGGLDPIHPWHHHVAEQEVRLPCPGFLYGLCAVVGDGCIEPVYSQNDRESIRNCALIIGSEDFSTWLVQRMSFVWDFQEEPAFLI
jgi:hypothetical protein